MGSILGLGRGKKAANYAMTGFNYLKDNNTITGSQNNASAANATLASALGLGGGGSTGGSSFDASSYFSAYPDVAQAAQGLGPEDYQFIADAGYSPDSQGFAQYHYDKYGQAEGRTLPQGSGTGSASSGTNAAFDQFKNSMGYQTNLKAGQDAITSSAAAAGNLNSGATLKGLQEYGTQLNQQYYGDFLDRIMGVQSQGQTAALGTGAAGSSAGSTAASSQPQNTGILGRVFGI